MSDDLNKIVSRLRAVVRRLDNVRVLTRENERMKGNERRLELWQSIAYEHGAHVPGPDGLKELLLRLKKKQDIVWKRLGDTEARRDGLYEERMALEKKYEELRIACVFPKGHPGDCMGAPTAATGTAPMGDSNVEMDGKDWRTPASPVPAPVTIEEAAQSLERHGRHPDRETWSAAAKWIRGLATSAAAPVPDAIREAPDMYPSEGCNDVEGALARLGRREQGEVNAAPTEGRGPMATKKANGKKAERAVIVTTEHRGVFFGYATETDGDTIRLRAARNCIYWSADVRGFLGLAATGPSKSCRVGPPADLTLRAITCVAEVTPAAVAAWEGQPWA